MGQFTNGQGMPGSNPAFSSAQNQGAANVWGGGGVPGLAHLGIAPGTAPPPGSGGPSIWTGGGGPAMGQTPSNQVLFHPPGVDNPNFNRAALNAGTMITPGNFQYAGGGAAPMAPPPPPANFSGGMAMKTPTNFQFAGGAAPQAPTMPTSFAGTNKLVSAPSAGGGTPYYFGNYGGNMGGGYGGGSSMGYVPKVATPMMAPMAPASGLAPLQSSFKKYY